MEHGEHRDCSHRQLQNIQSQKILKNLMSTGTKRAATIMKLPPCPAMPLNSHIIPMMRPEVMQCFIATKMLSGQILKLWEAWRLTPQTDATSSVKRFKSSKIEDECLNVKSSCFILDADIYNWMQGWYVERRASKGILVRRPTWFTKSWL